MKERNADQRRSASYPKDPRRPRAGSRKAGWRRALLAVAAVGLTTACTTVPITGRSSFNLFPLSRDIEIGNSAQAGILEGQDLATRGPELRMVERVMGRLVSVADDPGYDWEVTLIQNDATVNAFALPGGKMAVYTGILPFTQTENGLAVVMGHEIGHVIARHGSERMTQNMGKELLFAMLDAGDNENLARKAVSLIVELPYSRRDESEADHIGLIYMARAGYDPREAVDFWTRMAQGSGKGGGVLEAYTSTHPSHATRIEQLQSLMPEALAIYDQRASAP